MSRRGKKSWLLFGCGVALAVFAVLVLLASFISVGLDYDKAKQEYIAAGLPFEANDLVRNVPDEENAAIVFEKIGKYRSLGDEAADFSDEKGLLKVEKHLDSNRAIIDSAVEASNKPYLEWNCNWSDGSLMILMDRIVLRNISYDLSRRAEARSARGDISGSLSDFRALCRLAVLARQDYIQLHGLYKNSIYTRIAALARKLANTSPDDRAFLTSLSNELEKIQSGPNLINFVKSDAYCSVWHFRNIQKLGGVFKTATGPRDYWNASIRSDYKGPFASEGDVKGFFAKAMMANNLRFYKDLHDILENEQGWFTYNAKVVSRVGQAVADESLSGRPLNYMANDYLEVLNSAANSQADIITTRAALLLMAAKAEGKGSLQVKDLEGEWLDPYTGRPLRNTWQGNAVKVWSVGEDGKDDGGVTVNPSGFGAAPDVGAELPFAKVKPVGLTGPRGGPPPAGSYIPGIE